MILNISRVSPRLILQVFLEFSKYSLQRFLENIGKSIESSSVCHTETYVLNSFSGCFLYQVIFLCNKKLLNPEIIESNPSTPNLLLVLSLSFKKELNDSTFASSSRILSLYSAENLVWGIFSISFISQAFSA